MQSRDRVLELLGAALKPLGEGFDVQDISILPVRARIDLQDFPIDFAIVVSFAWVIFFRHAHSSQDKQNPKGIPPGSEAPSIYDLRRVVLVSHTTASNNGDCCESGSSHKHWRRQASRDPFMNPSPSVRKSMKSVRILPLFYPSPCPGKTTSIDLNPDCGIPSISN